MVEIAGLLRPMSLHRLPWHDFPMSHQVEPSDLSTEAEPRGNTPYLLYSGSSGSARVNHVVVESIGEGETDETVVTCRGFGRGVAERVGAEAPLSLLWPAPGPGEFSLIADGQGRIEGETLLITIEAAVLHRPAPVDGDLSC